MNKTISNIFYSALITTAVFLTGCTKEEGPLTDVKPAVPVTVQNAVYFRPEPTVTVSKTAVVSPGVLGPIQIILNIPSTTGRKIKEITKITASTSYTSIRSTGTTGFYNTAAIVATSPYTVTFNTTLTEYTAKTGQAVPASNTELLSRFYFRVTLDDNSILYTTAVRVLVLD